MDDWDEIVRDAGEEHFEDAQERLKSTTDTISSSTSPEPQAQRNKTASCAEDNPVDHDDAPANDEEQCRICFCGAEEEPELGVS